VSPQQRAMAWVVAAVLVVVGTGMALSFVLKRTEYGVAFFVLGWLVVPALFMFLLRSWRRCVMGLYTCAIAALGIASVLNQNAYPLFWAYAFGVLFSGGIYRALSRFG
jgi:hypothetical protein